MKSIIITLFLALITTVGHAQTDKFEVEVNGLGCPYCASGLEDAFKDFDGISDIKIDIQEGMFTFSVPAEIKLSIEKVEKTIEKASYTAAKTKVERANGTIETSDAQTTSETSSTAIKTETFVVAGECEMCKKRIDTAAKAVPGVLEASWEVESQELTVKLNPEKTDKEEVQKAVAAVGHDTKTFKAADETYENLHACCHYTRLK